jgi:hypothetical protein
MRNLRLTTPLMAGSDVRELQIALNHRATARGLSLTAVDAQFGPDTDSLTKQVAWLLGIGSKPLSDPIKPYAQRLIEHPNLRNPVQLVREKKRWKSFKKDQHSVKGTLDWCRAQVGTTESPAGSNRGPLVSRWERDFHMDGQPWCGAFVGYGLRHVAGVQVPDGVVYTPNIIGYARAKTGGFEGWYSWSRRKPGDLILFKWPGVSSAPCDHVGILDEDGNHTIEGNTSSGSSGSQNNGGGVYRRARGNGNVVGCARPRYR